MALMRRPMPPSPWARERMGDLAKVSALYPGRLTCPGGKVLRFWTAPPRGSAGPVEGWGEPVSLLG